MDKRTDIASRLLAGLFAGNSEISFESAVEIAVSATDDLMKYLEETTPQAPQETEPDCVLAGTGLRHLGVSGRACAPLERMGIETLEQLADQTRKDISTIRGVSTNTMERLDGLLEAHGLSWGPESNTAPEPGVEEGEDNLL